MLTAIYVSPEGVKNMAKERATHQDRIVRDPNIMAGKPVVKGTRIPVELVLAHLAENPDLHDLFGAFPRLTLEDVRACLDYARAAVGKQRPRPPRQRQVASPAPTP